MSCPDNGDGIHRPTSAYDPVLCGVANRCSCGYVWLFPTDAMLEPAPIKSRT